MVGENRSGIASLQTWVIALDLGENTGVAVFSPVDPPFFQTWRLTPGKDNYLKRYVQLDDKLSKLAQSLPSHESLTIVYEKVNFMAGPSATGRVQSAHQYGGYEAVLAVFAEYNHYALESIPVTTIRKHTCGNGRAKKDAAVEAARLLFPGAKLTNDTVDAALVGWTWNNIPAVRGRQE